MIEVIFLLSFTLHNIEEGIWLPRWSKHAGKLHPKVSNNEFHFALLVVTILGYLLTFLFLKFGMRVEVIKYIYLSFILMMCLNSIFPHLLATIILKRYSPGTLTGLLLNMPIGVSIILENVNQNLNFYKFICIALLVIVLTISSLQLLFKIGKKLIDEY